VTEIGRPAYQQVADDLRSQIASGDLAVGAPIPSTAQLSKRHGVSITVVRAAINQLRAAGLVVGHPGKAVYVRATPEALEVERIQLDDLAREVRQLRSDLGELTQVPARDDIDTLRSELAALRREVGVLHTQLIDLYGRVGQPYPHAEAGPSRETQGWHRSAASGHDT